jgi:DNA-binding MarR family transcriptional regulator
MRGVNATPSPANAPGPPANARPTRPDAAQLAVWRAFLRSHATIVRSLETELAASGELPLASYDVLVQLTEADSHRLRMTELAERVLLSRSGLTRLVDRLERDGLVVREPYPDDARGMYAVVTGLGIARLRAATAVHLPGVVRHFVSLFSPAELQQLGSLLERLDRQPLQVGAAFGQGEHLA